MTKPLEATEIAAIDSSATKAERIWKFVPILGWGVAGMIWHKRTQSIVSNIERQLQSRPRPDSRLWGHSAARTALAQYVCEVAKEEMGWPNDHFIPDDPASVVFWAHEDGLDVEVAVMEIEEHLGIKLEDTEVETWFTQTLGEVVEFLWVRQQAHYHQEDVWPPAPDWLK